LEFERAAGIILHPTSLPSDYGIGELGREAIEFIDFLAAGRQKLWQILPLNPVGYGESPYQCYSAFAGNTLLISLEKLGSEGFLTKDELAWAPEFPLDRVDFKLVKLYKNSLLRKAFYRFSFLPKCHCYLDFVERNRYWLPDFALFMSLKEYFSERPWNEWDKEVALRDPEALKYYEKLLATDIKYHYFLQYKFHCQWIELKEYAKKQGITIIGDLPIFVSYDSSDTWVNPHLFTLDAEGYPAKVAGVPPDYFSETGQLWGNPHYRWNVMGKDDFFWWRQRFEKLLEWVDVIRIDHFRGFEAYWEINGAAETAVNGKWVKGPDKIFFATIEKYLGRLPIIAEDLGFITPEVVELREAFSFPGMKVLQFTWQESLTPDSKDENVIFYTGTHDNDTLLGWYKEKVIDGLRVDYDSLDKEEICYGFLEIVYQSRAKWALAPLQDILCLGRGARMNTPGTVNGNWQWRYSKAGLTERIAQRLAELTEAYAR